MLEETYLGGMPLRQDIICAGPLTEDALSRAMADFLRRLRPRRQRLFDY